MGAPNSKEGVYKLRTDPDLLRLKRYSVRSTVLGKGSFSEVRLGRDTETNKKVAIKIIPKNPTRPTLPSMLHREREAMKMLSAHSNIVKFVEDFEDDNNVYIIMEYIRGGDLIDFIEKRGRLTERRARKIFLQLLDAVEYCHNNRVIHRDIKLENIMFDQRSQTVKLIDFGLSDIARAPTAASDHMCVEHCGSLAYCSPEMLGGEPYHGVASDMWNLGVVLYAMLIGDYPFWNSDQSILVFLIREGAVVFPSKPRLSSEVKDLIRSLLRKDPLARPSSSEVRRHPWIARYTSKKHEYSSA